MLKIVAAALVGVLISIPAAPAAAQVPAGSAGLFADAEALYAQAVQIIAKTPGTLAEAARITPDEPRHALFMKTLNRFTDHDLKDAGPTLSTYLGLELIAYGNFVGFAVQKTSGCDRARALVILHVAREYLDDAKTGASGMMAADRSEAPGDHPFPADREKGSAAILAAGICH